MIIGTSGYSLAMSPCQEMCLPSTREAWVPYPQLHKYQCTPVTPALRAGQGDEKRRGLLDCLPSSRHTWPTVRPRHKQTNKQKQMKESCPCRKRVEAGEGNFFFPERCLSIACEWVPQKVQHATQVQKLIAWNMNRLQWSMAFSSP